MSKVKIIKNKSRPKLLIVNIDQIFPLVPPQLYNWAVLHPLRSLLCSLSVVWSSWATLRPSAASALTRRWWSRCVGQPSVSCVRYASSSTSSWSLWPFWLSWTISWRSVSYRAHFVWEPLDSFLLFENPWSFIFFYLSLFKLKKKLNLSVSTVMWDLWVSNHHVIGSHNVMQPIALIKTFSWRSFSWEKSAVTIVAGCCNNRHSSTTGGSHPKMNKKCSFFQKVLDLVWMQPYTASLINWQANWNVS